MFLIWGYTTISVTLAVYIAFSLTKNYDTMWLWLALPLVGGVLTSNHLRKYKKTVQTHLDRAVNAVWIAFSGASLACMAFSFTFHGRFPFPILFIICLLMGLATSTTGMIIRFRPIAVMGFAAMAIAFVTFAMQGEMNQFLVFAGTFLFCQVIPGHLLNAACKREAAAAKAAQNGRAE